MKQPIRLLTLMCSALVGALTLCGCGDNGDAQFERKLGFVEFVPRYNKFIDGWLAKQLKVVDKRISEESQKLADASDANEKLSLEASIEALKREKQRYLFRQSVGEYFSIKTPEDLPSDLVWQNGNDVPAMGDPKAKKGGVMNYFITTFPATTRRFGKSSNHSFRSEIYDNIEMPLVGEHSLTGQPFGILAKEWAISEDGRTVYYKLREEATYSDGHPVKAQDYLVFAYLRLSDNVKDPFYKVYLREQFANFTTYGDHLLSVTLPEAKPKMTYYASITPSPSHFYAEYGPDFVQRYQWKVEPTTGAYTVHPEDIKKGRSITLSRVKDWWAADLPQLKYGYNVDKIVYHLVQDTSKAFELFRIGQLDYFPVSQPEYWYEKTEMEPVFKGYIEKATFYNIYPRVPWGFYPNVTKAPMDNKDVRVGLAYAMNLQKVINALFRADYDRLESFSRGFGEFTNEEVTARRFSVAKAREAFAKAGYTVEGEDGILRKPDGTKLEVELTFYNLGIYPKMMAILKEEAKKCGVDLVLDGQEPTLAFKKTQDKLHTLCYAGWGVTPPFPRYHQFFHSINGIENGKPKQQTNNLNCYADPRMDFLATTVRNARSIEELRDAAHEVQQIVHDEVLFIPAHAVPYRRAAYWRWLKWPDSKYTNFADPRTYDPIESYYYWVDEDVKAETLSAKRSGKEFPEKVHVFDRYRGGIPEEDKRMRATKAN
ncbi:ABC transporter substrate-binding protein [Rubritalea tangerina]|uniref:ABC transporter substrate-binding protein n=1 Tax=Rubritalea tangerina TaxID=430798 RepID=A0ABW4ZGB3_9BACT